MLAGGHVNVIGTLLGVTTIAIITQALVLFEIDPFIVQIFLGLLILGQLVSIDSDLRLTLFEASLMSQQVTLKALASQRVSLVSRLCRMWKLNCMQVRFTRYLERMEPASHTDQDPHRWYQPDEGSVNLLGQTVRFSDTNEARQQGIALFTKSVI